MHSSKYNSICRTSRKSPCAQRSSSARSTRAFAIPGCYFTTSSCATEIAIYTKNYATGLHASEPLGWNIYKRAKCSEMNSNTHEVNTRESFFHQGCTSTCQGHLFFCGLGDFILTSSWRKTYCQLFLGNSCLMQRSSKGRIVINVRNRAIDTRFCHNTHLINTWG